MDRTRSPGGRGDDRRPGDRHHVVARPDRVCGLRRRRLRSRVLGSRGGRHRARRGGPSPHRRCDRTGLGSEPHLADLRPRDPVDGVPAGVRGHHVDPVRAAHPGRGLGIVLRGAAFAFRPVAAGDGARRAAGAVFAISSVVTPFFLGAAGGAIASGRVPAGNAAGDPWGSWLNPTSALVGFAGHRDLRLSRRGLPGRRRAPSIATGTRQVLPAPCHVRRAGGRRLGPGRDRRAASRRAPAGRRADAARLAVHRRLRRLRDGRAHSPSPGGGSGDAGAGRRCGRRGDLGLGRRPVSRTSCPAP